MIGVGFLMRILQIGIYVSVFIVAVTVVLVGLSWVMRAAFETADYSLRDHWRWFWSKVPRPLKWVGVAMSYVGTFLAGLIVGLFGGRKMERDKHRENR